MNKLIRRSIAVSLGAIKAPHLFSAGKTMSETQKRMHAAWLADAPRRNALAAEIAEWNSKVKRRNQRHVRRNIARGRAA